MRDSKDPRRPDYREIVNQFRQLTKDPLKRTKKDISENTGVVVSVDSGLEEYTGAWTKQHVGHFLRRLLFGLKKEELDAFTAKSLPESVAEVLTLSDPPAPPVNDYTGEGLFDPDVAFGETWVDSPFSNDIALHRVISLKSWMINGFVNQQSTLEEKMVLFWHGLLVTEVWAVFIPKMSYKYLSILRKNCFGNFKTMIKELTVDPSMLIYLNGTFNTKEAADENYGRELQELFCVGKGPNSKYTEGDVQAAARVLTGWEVNWGEVEQVGVVGSGFTPQRHDTGDKQFSSFYNNKVIQGRNGDEGSQELDDLLDMIFETNETAAYICRRLYTYFVNSEIDASAEQNVIEPLAAMLRANNYEIFPVLETLLKSAHFHDFLEEGALIKSPAEYLLGIWRSMGMKYPNSEDVASRKLVNSNLYWALIPLGMEIGDPPGVAGWTPYYQAPLYDRGWITTSTIVGRARLTDNWLFNGFNLDSENKVEIDLINFVSQLSIPEDPNVVISESAELLLGNVISDDVRSRLKSVLLSGQETDSYWTEAWLTYLANPDEVNKSVVENRLKPAFQTIFQMAEFQLT